MSHDDDPAAQDSPAVQDDPATLDQPSARSRQTEPLDTLDDDRAADDGDEVPFIEDRIWWDEATPAEQPPQEEPPAAPAPPDHAAGAAVSPDQIETVAPTDEVRIDPESLPSAPLVPADATDSAPSKRVAEPPDGTRALDPGARAALAQLRSRRELAAAALRDVGRQRSSNQDSVFSMLTTLPRESSDLPLGLFVVADGMGGHADGDLASRLAISTVARNVLADMVVPALDDSMTAALQPLIVSAVQDANRRIWEQGRSTGSDMGTTCTAALLLGHTLYIAHVGDSRLYVRTPDGLRCLTTDHSAIGRLIQLGQLDPSEAREHPMRSQLYRTVGQMPEVQVDFIYHQLGNATHLLLCSDGLWGMIDEAVILDVLDNALWPQDACRELIARANLAGGEDNISAVVVTLPGGETL
ncbi:MAG TPA: protein phosphatase 2C domain-containing protein [Roseiflexaceae bacterium]|nr:protein phosphatase 2C domain-containing protein [Roseiflexaceae bacterium]